MSWLFINFSCASVYFGTLSSHWCSPSFHIYDARFTFILTTNISGHPSVVGRVHDRESLPVKHQHSATMLRNQTYSAPHHTLMTHLIPRQKWSLLNRFSTEQGHCGACRRKWQLTDTDLCPCGETQTMSHIVESCPLTKLNGGLSRLHSADVDAVSWLTSYG